jgi:hypothetical protein
MVFSGHERKHVGIIDQLEVVNVHHQQGKRRTVTNGSSQFCFGNLHEEPTVVQSGIHSMSSGLRQCLTPAIMPASTKLTTITAKKMVGM